MMRVEPLGRSGKVIRSAVVAVTTAGLLGFAPLPAADAAIETVKPVEKKLQRIINKKRARRDKDPLVLHTYIRKEARGHSRQMARQGFYDHRGQNKRNRRIWNKDAGVNGLCESIYRSAQPLNDPKKVAATIYRYWIRNNNQLCLFRGKWNVVGIGVVEKRNKYYATLISGQDSTPP